MRVFYFTVIIILFALPVWAGSDFRYGVNSEVSNVRPEKPVKIKLKRLNDGKYTWEITGDDTKKVIEADRTLRKEYKQ